jgi:CheY-like chemotaxis protein
LPFKRVVKAELIQSKLLEGISICAIGQNLSTSLIKTITELSGHFYTYPSLSEFCQQQENDPISGKLVLFTNEGIFSQPKNKELFFSCQDKITLLGLCQPVMKQLSSLTCQILEQLPTPYVLLDMPLFSISLTQIHKALAFDNTSNTEARGIETIHRNKPHQIITMREQEKQSKEDLNTDRSSPDSLTGVNVLLVEDNLVNQLVAKELLLNMQATVTIADNGQRALDLLEEQVFDVILMDIQMPIMDGLTAAKLIRAQTKYQKLPIIAMTAHARVEDMEHSLAAGMNLHMHKPVTGKVLLDSIKQVTFEL